MIPGFPPGMFERGGPKGVVGLGVFPQEKKNRVFKFLCLKWPILTEMTLCGAEWGGPDPPGPPPGGNPGYIESSCFNMFNNVPTLQNVD